MRTYNEVYNQSKKEVLDQRKAVFEKQKIAVVNVLKETFNISGKMEDLPKDELEQIIITYHKLEFENNEAQSIFQKENFERSIQILGKTIRFSDHLMLDKLAETYNSKMSEGVNTRYNAIKESHDGSAKQWIDSLLDEVRENIVNYSPELSKLADKIKRITADIEDHEKRQIKLMEYKAKLQQMMNWKSIPEENN